MVELADERRTVVGRSGTEITLSPDAAVSRPFPPHGPDWEWTARLAPPLEMEGQTLRAFLAQAAREHGWTVRYTDPAVEQQAAATVLHGSVAGLSPREAIEVAVSTSALAHRFDEAMLVVLPEPAAR
jgi:hypothetical protein